MMAVPRFKPRRPVLPRKKPKREQVYNTSRWRKLSAAIRRARPVCEVCTNDLTTEVHHKVPIDRAPALAFEHSNLVAVCSACHQAEHGRGHSPPIVEGGGA